jgi:hypothetical protein
MAHFEQDAHPQSVDGVSQYNPYWVLVVVPFKDRVTTDFSKIPKSDASSPVVTKNGRLSTFSESGDVVDLTDSCVNWRVTHSKSNHSIMGNFTLVPPQVIGVNGRTIGVESYDIAPQDWVLFWAMDNEEDYLKVRNAISQKVYTSKELPESGRYDLLGKYNGTVLNGKNSGLKFVGKVRSFKRNLAIASNGLKMSKFFLECFGFSEFDGTILYNQIFSGRGGGFGLQLSKLLTPFVLNSPIQPITTQKAVPFFTNLLLNLSARQVLSSVTAEGTANLNSFQASYAPNMPFIVPETVAFMLGNPKQKDGVYTYGDILYQYIGIDNIKDSTEYVRNVSPIGSYPNTYSYNRGLTSTLLVQTVQLDSKTIWGIVQTYSGHPVTEIFTAMKLNHLGNIVPTFICRRLPFTSKAFDEAEENRYEPLTRYTHLPRWKIRDDQISMYDIGLTDSVDINYIKIEQSIAFGDNATARVNQMVNVPPVIDSADVARNGLRPYSTISAVAAANTSSGQAQGRFYTKFLADFMFKLKYTANGNVSCRGIQAPICIGDNAVVAGMLFHIEAITHDGTIDMSGSKRFTTTLSLSHGIQIPSDDESESVPTVPEKLRS